MKEFGVKSYAKNKVKILCANCEQETETNVPKESKFMTLFNEYENLNIPCAHCPTILVVNMNIPESDYEEFEFEVENMPFFEINARKQIRDLMFENREDLKKLKADEKARRSAKKDEKLKLKNNLSIDLLKEQRERQVKKAEVEHRKPSKGGKQNGSSSK